MKDKKMCEVTCEGPWMGALVKEKAYEARGKQVGLVYGPRRSLEVHKRQRLTCE